MKALYGLYRTPQAAQRAFDSLREMGVASEKITIMSSEPLEEYEFGSLDRSGVIPWMAAVGALIGFAGAYLLTSLTQQAWPINTGGMPIVTRMTNTIILFELTMLGAVLASVFTLLVTARIPRRRLPELYDPEVSDGKILIGIAEPDHGRTRDLERALKAGPAESIRKIN
jgi:hypothetical protein